MSTRGTIKYWQIGKLIDIHIYDETKEHYLPNILLNKKLAISIFNREIINIAIRGF